MQNGFLILFLSGAAVEFAVCWLARKSRNRKLWQWAPALLSAMAAFSYCLWWSARSQMEFHEQGNCIGGALYVISFFILLIPPLMGIGAGRLFYWVFGSKETKE